MRWGCRRRGRSQDTGERGRGGGGTPLKSDCGGGNQMKLISQFINNESVCVRVCVHIVEQEQ